ncbi:hypothetical protein AARAC_010773 [Aspergillus arachidicola]|uniref:Protein kinase domain-containing protein n=1 Tax=Aspergillus arachidicola TaxID=656916 RepID=A0A2G7FRG5_9EURO|nr:hypothetical protein AARAC_010773 [Aspergillus arachidicola]
MSEHPADLLVFDPSSLRIGKELKSSEASSIFEVELRGHRYAMKVFHDNGILHSFGVCEQGHVPYYHGYIDRLDPARFQPHLNHFMNDSHAPNAILLEYLEDTEELNCVNYSDDRLQAAIVGLRGIHSALIHHRDVYPKNILIVRGPPERVVWIDFDVAVTFDSTKPMGCQADEYCNFKIELVKSFERLLKEDQRQGLPPNTKYY